MMIVADNLHVVNPEVAKAVAELNPDPIVHLVKRCQDAGAQAIDINSGPLPRSPEKRFCWLVETVQDVTTLPLVLDTTNPIALEAGLKVCRNRSIINGFSLEPAKLERILPLAVAYDADIIGYLLGPKSDVPVESDEMMAMAVDLFDAFSASGLPLERLIIDPVITPVSWDNGIRHNRAVLSLLRSLPDLLGGTVRTIAGISNLATGPIPVQRKIALENAYAPMLAAAGLDMALMNIYHEPTVRTLKLCDTLLGNGIMAWGDGEAST